jgi:hypothetical protein
MEVRQVRGGQWEVVAWLWQCFRHDLATIVSGLPYADGRYQTRALPDGSSDDVVAYLAWRPHPQTGEAAPIGFAVVGGLTGARRSLDALWIAPVVRGEGVGRRLALDVIARHQGPWSVAFQHDNAQAGAFWRRVADEAFGPAAWQETLRAVPGVTDAPPDHWIETV